MSERISAFPSRRRSSVLLAIGILIAGAMVIVVSPWNSSPTTTAPPASALTWVPSIAVTTHVATTVNNYEFTAKFAYMRAYPINCELDTGVPQGMTAATWQGAYCFSYTPSLLQNVRMDSRGQLKTCVGQDCGSNPGLNTPVVNTGTMITAGQFSCVVGDDYVECHLNGKSGNFRISNTAISSGH